MMMYTLIQNIKVMAGCGVLKDCGTALKEAGYERAFLVCDENIEKAGLADTLTKSLAAAGISYVLFDHVVPDPPADVVNEGGDECIKNGCDCVIAIGGGSAIDTAKGINILRVNGGNILDFADPSNEMKPSPGLMSIPTTSGTGSELSNGLIITDTENNRKVAILAVNGMSEFAVIDPELTYNMPLGVTLTTGLDVFSHAAEGYTSVLGTIATDMINEKLMETVVKYLPVLMKDPANREAREKMHVAASLGGWMLANSSAHIGHSFAHVIGGRYHIPHGACCAYTLPPVLRFISDEVPGKVRVIGEILGAEYEGDETPEQIGSKAADAYIRFRDETLGLKKIFDEDFDPDIDALVEPVLTEALAGLCVRPADAASVRKIWEEIFAGKN